MSFNRRNPPILRPGEIQLWQLNLQADSRQLDRYWNSLGPAERERAGRIATESLKRRNIVAQGSLRGLLSLYLGIPAPAIRFERGPHGKPRLAGTPPDRGLVFNVSHSGDRALIAIGRDMTLGVDIELWRPLRHLDGLARRCLAPSERGYCRALPEAGRLGAFFDFWTAKEAFVKAVGHGLALGLAECVLATDEEPRLIAVPDFCGAPEEWSLWRPKLGEGLSSALCAHTRHAAVRLLEFEHG